MLPMLAVQHSEKFVCLERLEPIGISGMVGFFVGVIAGMAIENLRALRWPGFILVPMKCISRSRSNHPEN
jgi:hypothetical protein